MKNMMKNLSTLVATMLLLVMTAMPVMAEETPAVYININGNDNTVTIYTNDEKNNSDVGKTVTLPSIPEGAKEVNIWNQGECRTSGYYVDEEVYIASYDDVKKIFPQETKTWTNIQVTQATPLFMWTDSFGYTYKTEANNVFLFQNGVKDTSGELIVAKPLSVYVDGKRISNITVYLSDEDATVFAGLSELKAIFSAQADKIVCSDVAHYTVNYWAEKFGYTMTLEDSCAMLTKKTESETPATEKPSTTDTKPATIDSKTSSSDSKATTTKTSSSSTSSTKKAYVSKKYKMIVENAKTTITPKTRLMKNVEKIYVTKKEANKILASYKKKKIKKAIDIKSLAKKCGVTCRIKGGYVFFNQKSNPATQLVVNGKVLETKSAIKNKKGKVYISSKIAKKLGVYVVNTAKSKKNKKKELFLAVNSLKNFGYNVSAKKSNGVKVITITRK